MQQYSSLPEQNSQVDATSKLLTKIQQLQAELWLERSLNKLQNSLNSCLVSFFTKNQQIATTEAEIFKTVVDELKNALAQGRVAIALVEPQKNVCKVSYTNCASCQSSSSLSFLEIRGKKLDLELEEDIEIEDLEFLSKQEPPRAWQLVDLDESIIGWLIVTTTSIPFDSDSLENRFIEISSELMTRAAKQCVAAIAQLKQIQSLQQHCHRLKHFNQELERTNQLKNQFLANTSHEIRTPLSSIIGFTHLLLAKGYEPNNERHQEYLHIIQSSGKHLLALINDILDLSKIEANQLEMQWETVDLPTLCRNILTLVKEKAANKGLKLVLELDPNVTTFVADSLRLKQMLLNLLFNALKFTDSGTVGLQVKANGSFMHFTVWDTGTGISQEHQAELFQPYFQIASAIVSREEGTGLGLAVTQKLAELHGGWVEVESEVERGSRFTIVLPLNQAEVEEEGERRRQGETTEVALQVSTPQLYGELPPEHLHTITLNPSTEILLVENDPPNAKLMQNYLESLGYQVICVKNAAQMWEVLNQVKPGIILLDVHLPDKNGLLVVKQLRTDRNYQAIPVIAQTAMAMKGDRETCLAAGFHDYISKPIDLPLLATLVSKYIKPPKFARDGKTNTP
ncbi:MAG: response regulator [Chlorogloeopsis fritschii C42_A2020_084]|uniref:hybrid histidine kinase/response regulator HrmK n=1 Tax=Chlorogloeopsis fritschii TaxID=1124 RepID=UPI001A05294A|nr:hybrid histidine kinase/response regulator HrmK [Chlorogloeopsis fritschii]MBF2006985.1 response regulator [Chlorogloeopsis fritschii C42_A2020_084]